MICRIIGFFQDKRYLLVLIGFVLILLKREGLSEPSRKDFRNKRSPAKVSIPFKREGLSELCSIHGGHHVAQKVSIPFKREALSEPKCWKLSSTSSTQVSIPFKREALSERERARRVQRGLNLFQFPSNGKHFQNRLLTARGLQMRFSFNSLQTGSTFRTRNRRHRTQMARDQSFNSLQTGSTFRTNNSQSETPEKGLFVQGFNSLQTGSTFRTKENGLVTFSFTVQVSIPFKREALSERDWDVL